MTRDNTNDPTPYAVICDGFGIPGVPTCGVVFLSEDEYTRQLDDLHRGWRCPTCGASAEWDDDSQATDGE